MPGGRIGALKRLAKAVVSPLLDVAGVSDRSIARRASIAGSWTIVTYHRIVDAPDADPFALGMCVRRPHFEAQLDYLASRFRIESVGSVAARLARGEPIAPRTLSITIDDGYLDNLRIAAPLLRARGLPASVYVVSGGLDAATPEPFWWDRVVNAVDATSCQGRIDGEALGIAGLHGALSLARADRAATVTTLLDALWSVPHADVLAAVARIEARLAPARDAASFAPRMREADVARLASLGVEIGAHTVRHPNLTLLDDDTVAAEMQESRERLARITGTAVGGFAYPAGRMDDSTVAAARAAGFAYSLSVCTGINLPEYDRYRLRRIGAPDAPLADFKRAFGKAMRASGGVHAATHEGPARPAIAYR